MSIESSRFFKAFIDSFVICFLLLPMVARVILAHDQTGGDEEERGGWARAEDGSSGAARGTEDGLQQAVTVRYRWFRRDFLKFVRCPNGFTSGRATRFESPTERYPRPKILALAGFAKRAQLTPK